jgi:hypothetical protein
VIRFLKNSTNNVVVTLTENSTVTNPIYLFMFTNQTSNVPYYFIGTDTSAYKTRYNKFSIVEKASANTLNGEVTLGLKGYYNYKVYQTSLYQIDDFITRVETDNGTIEAVSCLQTTLNGIQGLTTAADAVPYITKTVEVGVVEVVFDTVTNTEYDVQDETNIIYQP